MAAPSVQPAADIERPPAGAMHLQTILVPTDFSEPSRQALQYAQDLANQFSAALVLLHVVEPAYRFPGDGLMHFPGDHPDPNLQRLPDAEHAMARLTDITARTVDVPVYGKVRTGTAYDQIAQAAEELNVDLIVISTRGYTGLKHVFLGSVAEKVVRHAPCPVLVVRSREPRTND